MFAPTTSLIFITSDSLARVDLKGRNKLSVAQCWQRPIISSASPAALVATAMKLGPSQATRVWVLSSELSALHIALPLEVTVLLAPGELEHALAIEAEGESGIAATASRVGYIREDAVSSSSIADGDEERYWVTHVSDSEIEVMQSAVRAAGGQLVAIAHPHAAAMQIPASRSGELPVLSNIESLSQQWCQLLSGKHPWNRRSVAGVIYAKTRSQSQSAVSIQIVASLLVCGCLTALAWHKRERCSQLASEIAVNETILSDRAIATNQIKSIANRVLRLREEVTKITQQQQQLQRNLQIAEQTARHQLAGWSELLDAISQAAADDCWIQSWQCEKQQILLHGLAIDQTSVHRFVGRLDERLRSRRWSVLPADTTLGQQDLISFSITIVAIESTNELSNAIVSTGLERQVR